jgi:hypothetical protein
MFGRMAVFDLDIGFFSYLIGWLGFSGDSGGDAPGSSNATSAPIGGRI